ncbi:hypothetical protein FBR4_2200 [Lactiplantibacillus plantarum]|uniref:Uncharacterized protein n=1 Tax=Lactiplantibacillus plantarum TaxID=1590 RepID=A0A166I3V9_LACPN|nr:Hypothetical protein zj316_1915 [Lactiplantibacillus plantarum ZJ316]AGL64263.2 hypothetical protein LBP_cg1517 [Lactiplantibacillus plantarum subsp. plantarum P-8]ASL80039.1 hypothetical protein GBLP1_g1555 [Lactiplantibacillus plantarum]EMP43726.1 Hypothetical protein H073_10292 [Lactiplantibacillus plantarum UCMA 3037]KZD93932.1 hypothetical protein FBR4_2200 [Lactiplantibacillus plantarum]
MSSGHTGNQGEIGYVDEHNYYQIIQRMGNHVQIRIARAK